MSIYSQYPVSGICECRTFYRIFFGHEYRIAIGKGKVGRRVGMMVWKRVRGEWHAQFSQMLKEALRITDAGNGMIARFVEIARSCCQAVI